MLVRLPGAFDLARYYDARGTRLRSANDARTISAVGEPLSPSRVAYILQLSAYPARSGTGNRSSPSTLIVGLPGNRSLWASSSVLTATNSTTASAASWASTVRKVFSASRYVGHPSKYSTSTRMFKLHGLSNLDGHTLSRMSLEDPIHRSAWNWISTNFALGAFCEVRHDGVLGSGAAEACRQAHGGRVLESPPNHGYHPTNFRKNSNRLWFLRLLPMLRADDAQPDGNRRMPDDSDFRADQRHTQRPDYDRADAVGKQRRDLSREVLSCGGTDLCRCWPHRP